MIEKYKLLKDLPTVKTGSIFININGYNVYGYRKCSTGYDATYTKEKIEKLTDWFSPYMLTTEDGIDIYKDENCCYLKNGNIYNEPLTKIIKDFKYFYRREKAEKYYIDQIKLPYLDDLEIINNLLNENKLNSIGKLLSNILFEYLKYKHIGLNGISNNLDDDKLFVSYLKSNNYLNKVNPEHGYIWNISDYSSRIDWLIEHIKLNESSLKLILTTTEGVKVYDTDWVDGNYYVIEYNGFRKCIFKAKKGELNIYSFINLKQKTFGINDRFVDINDIKSIKPASKKQIEWLKACEKAGKFIKKPKKELKFNLKKDEYYKSKSKRNINFIFRFNKYSDNGDNIIDDVSINIKNKIYYIQSYTNDLCSIKSIIKIKNASEKEIEWLKACEKVGKFVKKPKKKIPKFVIATNSYSDITEGNIYEVVSKSTCFIHGYIIKEDDSGGKYDYHSFRPATKKEIKKLRNPKYVTCIKSAYNWDNGMVYKCIGYDKKYNHYNVLEDKHGNKNGYGKEYLRPSTKAEIKAHKKGFHIGDNVYHDSNNNINGVIELIEKSDDGFYYVIIGDLDWGIKLEKIKHVNISLKIGKYDFTFNKDRVEFSCYSILKTKFFKYLEDINYLNNVIELYSYKFRGVHFEKLDGGTYTFDSIKNITIEQLEKIYEELL